jgi:MFS transporter, DHA2 family, multidrug resistance protein
MGGLLQRVRPKGETNPWVIALTVMLATFMEVLDTSIANVALPHIAGNLSAGVDESTWVLTSYLVSNAIVLPLTGWFSTLFGRKRFYMGCVVVFTISSFLCGLAPNLGLLVLFRVLQGAGGGGLQPVSQAILVESFPKNKQGMAMAVYGMGVVLAPIIGPTLGGWITDNYTWRWIFFINIPVGALSILMTTLLISDPPYLARKSFKQGLKIDFIGLGLLGVGLGFLQVVLDKGERDDWFGSNFIMWCSVVTVVALVAAIIWELFQEEPVIELRLFKDRNFALATFTMFMLGLVLYGTTVLLPIFLQTLMGYTAELSGWVLSPGGLLVMLAMPIVGRLLTKVEARWLIVFGLAIVSVGMYQMSHFDLDISLGVAMKTWALSRLGLAFLFVPINVTAFYFISKEKTNNATGLINLARNVGGSVGISFVTTLLARRAQFHQQVLVSHLTPLDQGYQRAVQGVSQALQSAGSSAALAMSQAHGLIYGNLVRQSNMLAFVDDFRLMAVVCVALIPMMFLMKKAKPHKGPVAAH